MRVDFHAAAAREVEEAQAWYEGRSMFAASAFLRELSIATNRIREAPMRYAAAEHGTRRILLEHFPYADSESRQRRRQRPEAIMPRVGLIGAFIVLALGGAAATDASHLRLQAVASWNDYDDFMKLSADQRRARFVAISAENKAMIVQTHAQRWLHNNRGRLTTSEVGVFEEIIAFITPDLYRERPDDTLDKREQEVRTTMRCRVSPDDVREATNVLRAERASRSQKPTWTYLNEAKCWIDWFVERLVDYIPSQPR